MTKFTIFYAELSEEDTRDINAKGWAGSKMGVPYLDAQGGTYEAALRLGLMKKVAEAEIQGGFEQLFYEMQNLDQNWNTRGNFTCLTKFPRSQSVGDVIYIHDTDEFWRVASFGHNRVDPIYTEEFRKLL